MGLMPCQLPTGRTWRNLPVQASEHLQLAQTIFRSARQPGDWASDPAATPSPKTTKQHISFDASVSRVETTLAFDVKHDVAFSHSSRGHDPIKGMVRSKRKGPRLIIFKGHHSLPTFEIGDLQRFLSTCASPSNAGEHVERDSFPVRTPRRLSSFT